MNSKVHIITLALAATLLASGCSAAVSPDNAPAGTAISSEQAKATDTPSPSATPEQPAAISTATPFTARITPETERPQPGQTIRVTGIDWIPGSELEVGITARQAVPAPDADGMITPPDPIYLAGPVPVSVDAQGRLDVQITVEKGTAPQGATVIVSTLPGSGGESQGSATTITIANPE